jgi:hypothetical protein
MSRTPEEVRSRPVLASTPELWAGPSFLFSTGRYGGWRLLTGGWRHRCTDWERRFTDAGLRDDGEADTPWGWHGHAQTDPAAEDASGCEELEVVLDSAAADYLQMPGHAEALRTVLGEEAAAELTALPPPGTTSITRNRPLLASSATGLRVADLRFSTLPYGHGDPDRPIQYASRWLRLAASADAVVSLWAPLEGAWAPENIRWPHHAVPSRRVGSLQLAARGATPTARLASILGDCLEHETYYLDTWQMELEAWEANVYSSLSAGDSVLRGVDLSDPVRARAGTLAAFLSRTEFDLRRCAGGSPSKTFSTPRRYGKPWHRRSTAPAVPKRTTSGCGGKRLAC